MGGQAFLIVVVGAQRLKVKGEREKRLKGERGKGKSG